MTKFHDASACRAAVAAGLTTLGENRVQEALGKIEEVPGALWHLLGHLQTNKARDAVALFDVIETLDRLRLAQALADAAARVGRCPRLYVEVNTGEELQKAGVLPAEADGFLAAVRGDLGLPVEGLMCIPPQGEAAGPHFALLHDIAARNGLERLSMGMSADFETAIRFGATAVRVGSALFGAR